MLYVNPNNTLTQFGRAVVHAAQEFHTPEAIAIQTGLPVHAVRSALGDLRHAGYVREAGGRWFSVTHDLARAGAT